MSDDVQSLLNEGLGLLNEGKRAEAADVLKRAIELDSENIAIWTALSQAVESRDEKRIVLTTILQLDPGNEEAQNALEALEKPAKSPSGNDEWKPGITQREFRTAIIGLTLFTVVVLGIAIMFASSRSAAIGAQRQDATNVALEATQLIVVQTERAFLAETQAAEALETQLAISSPTPTPTPTPVRVLPTAIPPSPTPTETPDTSRFAPPPPANLGGRLLATGGRLNQVTEFRPILIYPAGGGNATELNEDVGQSPTADDGFSRIAYTRSVPGGGVSLLTVQTAQPSPLLGIDVINALFRIPASEPRAPRMTRNGTLLAFNALIENRQVLFTYEYATDTLTRITPNDGADYLAVDISPDGTRGIAVKRTTGTDLVLINLDASTTFAQSILTNDSNVLIEDTPAFSPDGSQVVFSAAGAGGNAELYIAVLQGNAFTSVSPLVSLPGNDRNPVFSPNGTHIAFTSDTTGTDNIFIFDLQTRETYQRTVETSPVIVSGWTN